MKGTAMQAQHTPHHKTRAARAAEASALEAIFAAFERDGYSAPTNTNAPTRARTRAWRQLYRAGTIARQRRNGALVWVLVA
jgi:hypothetical protein